MESVRLGWDVQYGGASYQWAFVEFAPARRLLNLQCPRTLPLISLHNPQQPLYQSSCNTDASIADRFLN